MKKHTHEVCNEWRYIHTADLPTLKEYLAVVISAPEFDPHLIKIGGKDVVEQALRHLIWKQEIPAKTLRWAKIAAIAAVCGCIVPLLLWIVSLTTKPGEKQMPQVREKQTKAHTNILSIIP